MRWLRGLPVLARLTTRALALGKPEGLSAPQRLANIVGDGAPVEAPVEMTWDAHQIPSIRALNEHDLAVGLGVVHAHLRLAQMELMRRLATGTVSEVLGRAAMPLDQAVRLMRLGAAVPAMAASLPLATRRWAEAFIAGVNHHIARAPAHPYEFRLLRIAPDPWTLHDLLLISRLVATDISWMLFSRLLPAQAERSAEAWDQLWPELQSGDMLPWPQTPEQAAFGLVRGSNSAAVAASAARRMLSRPDLRLLSSIWTARALIGKRIASALPGVMRAAARDAARALRRYRTWGGAHRMSVRSPLAALPGVGRWFAAAEWVAAGGNETINKSGHGPVRGRHRVTYGACARHLSDLADPDANWFVLLGGQDGWPGSASAFDQIALWRAGKAVRVPLRHEATADWPHLTRLTPS